MHLWRSVLLLVTGDSSNWSYFANIISNVGSCGNGLQKKLKSNETRESSWYTTDFTYYLNCISAKKNFGIFSLFRTFHHLSINLTLLEGLLLQLVFKKEFAFFLLLSPMSGKQKSIIIERFKITGSIYRILKFWKTIFLGKTLTKQFILKDL